MKHAFVFGIVLLILSSCCRPGDYDSALVSVSYPNIDSEYDLYAVHLSSLEDFRIKDTLWIGTLSSMNNFTLYLNFDFFRSDQIIYVDATSYSDTITDINVVRSNCDETIRSLEYKLNGVLLSDQHIEITEPG